MDLSKSPKRKEKLESQKVTDRVRLIEKECRKSYNTILDVTKSLQTGFAIIEKPKTKSLKIRSNTNHGNMKK